MVCWHFHITLKFGLWDHLGPWEAVGDRVPMEHH